MLTEQDWTHPRETSTTSRPTLGRFTGPRPREWRACHHTWGGWDLQQRSSLLAELARDLEREAESLKLRAHLLSHRAPPPKSERATAAEANPALREAIGEPEAQNKELVKTKRELDEKQKELAATRDELEAVFAGVGLGEGADDELRKARRSW